MPKACYIHIPFCARKCYYCDFISYTKKQYKIEAYFNALTKEIKQEILKSFTLIIADMDLKIVNVIIDKTKFRDMNYPVLENALKYNIQRIENDSDGNKYYNDKVNQPISYLIEDILEKDSKESHFIQICDFVSFFVHLYFMTKVQGKALPNRVGNNIDISFVGSVMATLKERGKLNLKASGTNEYGLVIYPK